MGFLDKLKNAFKGDSPAAAAPPPPPPPAAAAPEPEPEPEPDDDEADDFGGWDPQNWKEYWKRSKAIELAGNTDGDDAADAKCRSYGLRDFRHFQRVRDTFSRNFGHVHEFMQAAMNAGTEQARDDLQAAGAAHKEIFEPVEGVSLEQYAKIQAGAATAGDWPKYLAGHGIDEAKWARVSGVWNQRMSGQGVSDPNATFALLAEYGKFFGQAGQGQYGASAAANAGAAGIYGGEAGGVGAAPVTLDRYCEIMGAQSAWAQQGKDVNVMLKSHFDMTAIGFSNISQYWSAEISRDYRIGIEMGDLQTKWEKRYMASGGGGADSDLSV